MFGSRKDDEEKSQTQLLAVGSTYPKEASEEQAEQPSEPVTEEDQPTTAPTADTATSAATATDALIKDEPEAEQVAQKTAQQAPVADAKPELPEPAVNLQALRPEPEPEPEPEVKTGFFARMRQGLSKTRDVLVEGVARAVHR